MPKLFTVLALLTASHVALGQYAEVAAQNETEAWKRDVSPEHQERARARMKRGVALYVAGKCGQAMNEFRAAIEDWDHPAIRFNIATCLAELNENPATIYRELSLALRYGVGPLGRDNFAKAKHQLAALKPKLARLQVESRDTGATTTVAGEIWLEGPGTETRMVEPGTTVVVVNKPGVAVTSYSIELVAGDSKRIVAAVQKVDGASPGTQRMTRTSWSLAGVSIITLLAGGSLAVSSSIQFDRCEERPGRCSLGKIGNIERRMIAGDVVLGISLIAAAATGIVYWKSTDERIEVTSGGSNVSLLLRF